MPLLSSALKYLFFAQGEDIENELINVSTQDQALEGSSEGPRKTIGTDIPETSSQAEFESSTKSSTDKIYFSLFSLIFPLFFSLN